MRNLTMLLKNTIVAVIFGSTLVSLPALGQDNPTSKADISIQASMPFVESTNSDRAQPSAILNYGFSGGYRFFSNRRSGVEPSYGYTHNIQMYSLKSRSIGVKNNSDEVLAAYVFPFPAKRRAPSVLMGDFNLQRGIFPRTKHRGVFYNSATFNIDGPSLDRFPNRVEPAVVFGYNF